MLPGREQDVFLYGVRYRLWNAQAVTWENERCTDMLDQISWAFWRQ